MATILITGASGKTGREVLASLTMLGIDARPASRATGFDFLDRSGWSDHLAGVRSVFLLRPPAIADIARTLAPFVAAARASGVDHIVFLSVAGADRLRFLPHAAVERALLAGPRDWTILRPVFFLHRTSRMPICTTSAPPTASCCPQARAGSRLWICGMWARSRPACVPCRTSIGGRPIT